MTEKARLKRLLLNKQVHNFGFLFSVQASNILVSIIAIPLVINAIGVEQFGLVDLSLSIVYTLNVVVAYGFNLSAPREIALNISDKDELSAIFSRVLYSKFLVALSLIFVLVLTVQSFDLFSRGSTILLFSCVVLMAEALFPSWLAQGFEKTHLLSFGNLLGKMVYLGLLLLFVKSPQNSFLVNFLLGASGLLVNVSLLVYVTKRWGLFFKKVSLQDLKSSFRENFFLFLSSIAGYISVNSGLLILSFFASDYMLGTYSIAERVVRVLRIIPSIIIQAIYPKASKLYVDDRSSFILFLRKSFLLALIVCFGVSLLSFLFAGLIVEILANDRLSESVLILKALSFVPFMASLNIANMILVLVSDNKKVLLRSTWISFVFMIISCVALSSVYGPIGLAIGLLLTEIFTFVVLLFHNFLILPEVTRRFYGISISSYYRS